MIDPNLVFRFANIFFLVGTLLLICAIIKNRNVLRGFQPVGTLLTFIAMSIIQFNYAQISWWENFLLSLLTWAMWLFASIFSLRNWLNGWLDRRKGEREVYKMFGYKNKKEFEKSIKLVPCNAEIEHYFKDESN